MTRDSRSPTETRPTLFLDYDGVLHPDKVYRERDRIVLKMDGFTLFEWAPRLEEILMPHPDLQIVLSTSWVRVLGFDEALAWLPPGLQQRVVGSTLHPHAPEWRLSRADQILLDVANHRHQRWVAIDDDGAAWPDESRDRLVLTDPDLGLGALTAQRELREKLSLLHEPDSVR